MHDLSKLPPSLGNTLPPVDPFNGWIVTYYGCENAAVRFPTQ